MSSIIEIHLNGTWVPAAELRHVKNSHRAFFGYLPEYRYSDNPVPISLAYPVDADRAGVTEDGAPLCPAFVFDMVPQGPGREYLLQQLGYQDDYTQDILLAQAGAFIPVGNLRINSAVQYFEAWLESHINRNIDGLTREELLKLQDDFESQLICVGAGFTSIQGGSPKFLATQTHEGDWRPDAIVDDADASHHWLLKLPRSNSRIDRDILRMEAIYFSIVTYCGIRTHGECYTEEDTLHIQRFDRQVDGGRVLRLHQESLLSVAGIPGFPRNVSLFTLADAIARHATDPGRELAEFIKRELLNQAMGNTDNHGRNTAMQRLPDGTVQLTPLYDFAPMFLDPEGVPRACKWIRDGREVMKLEEIIELIDTTDDVRHAVHKHLEGFRDVLEGLSEIMKDRGLDAPVIELLHYKIESAKSALA